MMDDRWRFSLDFPTLALSCLSTLPYPDEASIFRLFYKEGEGEGNERDLSILFLKLYEGLEVN